MDVTYCLSWHKMEPDVTVLRCDAYVEDGVQYRAAFALHRVDEGVGPSSQDIFKRLEQQCQRAVAHYLACGHTR